MKVLVATSKTQGQREGDFNFVPEGELVMPGAQCDNACSCGCARAFTGIACHKGTTTFEVVDRPIIPKELRADVKKSLKDGGWLEFIPKREQAKTVRELTDWIMTIAQDFKVGSVIERIGSDGEYINEREI